MNILFQLRNETLYWENFPWGNDFVMDAIILTCFYSDYSRAPCVVKLMTEGDSNQVPKYTEEDRD